MRKRENYSFWQVNHEIKRILGDRSVVVLPSPEAYGKLPWTRKHFGKKPSEGYFIWVREQVGLPLSTCITIASQKISQDLSNLLVVEEGVKAKAGVVCNVTKPNLRGTHKAQGKLILRKGASLEYQHLHRWGKEDFVSPEYQFVLEEGSCLSYTYKNLFPPKKLRLKTAITSRKNSSCNLNIVVNGRDSEAEIKDTIRLKGDGSRGVIRLRLVGDKKSKIVAHSRMIANAGSTGHVDCMGLLLAEDSSIKVVPALENNHKDAQLTHEASVGRISEEVLNYLRSRGLTEAKAIDLVVGGFLGEEEPTAFGGQTFSSKDFM